MKIHRWLVAATTALAGAAVLAGCGSSGADSQSGADERSTRLALVSYSTPREVYPKQFSAFAKTEDGRGISFEESYGSSGEQSRAVEGGLAADVVAFSLDPDVQRLVDAGKVAKDWRSGPHKGMVTRSVVVLAVRKGNPKKIRDWDDLLDRDIEVVTPNPFTSGGARWNLMAAYGAWTRSGDSRKEALDKLERLLRNTPVQSKSAREALQVFAAGKGDVMLAYENEALLAQDKGEQLDFVIPESTILIENPIAVTSGSKHRQQAQAFVDHLLSPAGQRIYAKNHYRPVDEQVAAEFEDEFPQPRDLFTIEEFGGWDDVMAEFFDRERGEVAKIEQRLGVSTDG